MLRLALSCLTAAVLAVPSAASAGVLTSEPGVGSGTGGASGSTITYRATGDPSSRIIARSLSGQRLLLEDTRSRIVLAAQATRECSFQGSHSVICVFVAYLRVVGGNRGDVIDARRFTGDADLEGGSRNDVIYAPARSRSTLSGGGGHNVLIGGMSDETSASYEHAVGPVAVDLAKKLGRARDEHDRLIRIDHIEGSKSGANRLLSGTRGQASLSGGSAENYLVARTRSYVVVGEKAHRPNTVICEHAVSYVSHEEAADLILGTCAVGQIQLSGPMRTAFSAVLSVDRQDAAEQEGSRVTRVTVTAVTSGAIVGEVAEPESGAAPEMICRLNAGGRALLRRRGHLHVRVTEFDTSHPFEEARSAPAVYDTFTTHLVAATKPA